MIARCGQHALDLMVLALLDLDFQLMLASLPAVRSPQRLRLVMQLHTGQQGVDQCCRHGLCRRGQIQLGHMAFRRGHRMIECTVIGEQQQAGRVMVEAADGLHITPAEFFGQQTHHAGMMAGLA